MKNRRIGKQNVKQVKPAEHTVFTVFIELVTASYGIV